MILVLVFIFIAHNLFEKTLVHMKTAQFSLHQKQQKYIKIIFIYFLK